MKHNKLSIGIVPITEEPDDWKLPPIVAGDVPGAEEVTVKFQLPAIIPTDGVGFGLGGVGVGLGGVGVGAGGAGIGTAPAPP